MQNVQEHIKNAPASYLSHLRSKFVKKSGLIQNSKIHDELCNAILNEERLKEWLKKRSEWELLALSLIYASQSRGLHTKELEHYLEVNSKSLLAFLNEATNKMFIWHAKYQKEHIYYGFTNFENHFFKFPFPNEGAQENAIWVSNDKKAELYILLLLSKIQLGKIFVKKNNSFSYSTKKHIDEIFSYNKNFSSLAADDCMRILFSFLIYEKWVTKDSVTGCLKLLTPAYDFLQNNGFRLFAEFIFWWEFERFKNKTDLLNLLKHFEKEISASNAAWLFWTQDTHSKPPKNKTSITWSSLPLLLKELWIIGILKMQVKKKQIITFSLSDFARATFFAEQQKVSFSEPLIVSTSNFEWILSQNNGALRIFQMCCFAHVKNEEDNLRFTISKGSFLNALRSNIPNAHVQDFLSWNKAVPNVAAAIDEWFHIYNDSYIDDIKIIRIKNLEKFKELSNYKSFLLCTEETIPNWGFVIKAKNETKIKKMLENFSLEPHYKVLNKNEEEPFNELQELEKFNLTYIIPESEDVLFG